VTTIDIRETDVAVAKDREAPRELGPAPGVLDAGQFPHESLPRAITKEIVSFCWGLRAETPLYVGIDPVEGARQDRCHRNVLKHAALNGGSPLFGWMISEAPGLYCKAEFYCVWMQPHGGLSDITPRANESAILFAPDQTYWSDFDFMMRPKSRRERSYGMDRKKLLVEAQIKCLGKASFAQQQRIADRQGVTLTQLICSRLPGDRLEKLIDTFVREAGELDARHRL
jgi:hypothetical protein